MGYFSNGTEGMLYQEQWCNRCVHDEDCIIWVLHLRFNYKSGYRPILDALIPRSEDGLLNGKCRMFIEA